MADIRRSFWSPTRGSTEARWDNKGYLIRIGDKVLDGEVIRITPSSVVFRQEVNDPTRIERFREVVKELSPEAAKK